MPEHFQKDRQILFDLTKNYLQPLEGTYQRLAYLFSLREPSSGKYVHERLAAVYGEESVDHVLADCHEEVFERLLEMPLDKQQTDLHRHISSLAGSCEENVKRCRDEARNWIPERAPDYLKELYRSNLNALQELLQERKPKARSGK